MRAVALWPPSVPVWPELLLRVQDSPGPSSVSLGACGTVTASLPYVPSCKYRTISTWGT